ncbi:MAG: phage tail protein [Campylobacteraceae bacterium]|nr:phage tail protein [Campylobacteraceae bacterium]
MASKSSASNKENRGPVDPFVNYRYRVEIEGIEVMGFSSVSELSNETNTFSYKEGGLNNYEHKLPNGTTYANITLEHGLSLDNTLYEWREKVISGNMEEALKNGSIKVYSQNNLTSIWYFYGAWPSKMNISGLNASAGGSGAILLESIELVVERFERYSSTE